MFTDYKAQDETPKSDVVETEEETVDMDEESKSAETLEESDIEDDPDAEPDIEIEEEE